MAESVSRHHHKHRHHNEDYASEYKRKNLSSIKIRRGIEKWLKRVLFVLAIIMILLVVIAYCFA